MNIHVTCGDKEEAINIMKEAAQWLIEMGRPMWEIEELSCEKMKNSPEEFYVLWDGNESVAAMMLNFEDPFFWLHVAPNTSGFVHKLSVRRKFAGKGYAKLLIEHGKEICLRKEIHCLRLDCDPHRKGLLKFYDSCGFSLVEMKELNTKKWGTIDLAMYEMNF